ncbi:hypothetical protein PR202_ga22230 [Eleusine coracana subsp. coracana]|uniref:GOST seven transmembrane domain-containing protein n=1 Tax=Eleusine coracana subsp. coracana TaxID=191504 RepID=A0AAV5D314_ELECO|nr:hypothetical protein PR202_ga22230 [Eleusine coracana subsp. coracana]
MDLLRIAVLVAAALAAGGGWWGGGCGVEASIHTYDREPFREVGNAFLLSGGSEGIVADGADPAAPASSFINSGVRPVGITTWVVTVGAIRKTVSRLLILSISMGYGVVRPTLGGLTSKVLLLGLTYFLASEMLDIAENVGTINDISGKAKLFLVLPDAFLDAFLILWIFTSLSRTLEKLQARRSSVKLDIYRKFTNALAVSVIASVAWIGYEVYFKATDPFSERWQSAWIITAFWDVLAFVLLVVICYLWAPSQSSQRYAYSGEVADDDDEESQSLTKGTDGEVGMVKIDKDRNAGVSHAFSLEDETEEDKRE